MSKSSIFISCGQYTEEEKDLGRAIARMVRAETGQEPFFAEEVQDLNGLDTNILNALRSCLGFITVLHPRGEIKRPDGSTITRASVWIEQEIAIATYIQRVEKRSLPIIAFKHKSVSREGIRDLLQLNPIEFTDKMDVLEKLPNLLRQWQLLKPREIQLQLSSVGQRLQEGHITHTLQVTVVNDTSREISKYNLRVEAPTILFKHWSASYAGEVHSPDAAFKRFDFNQQYYGPVSPRASRPLFGTDYCTQCDPSATSAAAVVSATLWVDGEEYTVRKTMEELTSEAAARSGG